jgi:hypothetical protein
MTDVAVEYDRIMREAVQRVTDAPCAGCGECAGEKKDPLWGMCRDCSFGWMWLGIKPSLKPNYPND